MTRASSNVSRERAARAFSSGPDSASMPALRSTSVARSRSPGGAGANKSVWVEGRVELAQPVQFPQLVFLAVMRWRESAHTRWQAILW